MAVEVVEVIFLLPSNLLKQKKVLGKSSTKYLVAQHPTFQHHFFLKAAFTSGETKVSSRVSTQQVDSILWKGRVGGNFSSSPIRIGEEILNISSDGEMVTLVDGEEFQVLGRREVDEECRATPAVAAGILLVRTKSRLFALNISAP